MQSVIKALLEGDPRVASHFKAAKRFWKKFFDENRDASETELRERIGAAQFAFEQAVGKGGFAKEIMPLTALGTLYSEDNGFEEIAERVLRAFKGSSVSMEVQGGALKRAAAIYGLEDILNS